MSKNDNDQLDQSQILSAKKSSATRLLLLLVGGVFLIALVIAASISVFAWRQFSSFAKEANTTPQELLQMVEDGLTQPAKVSDGKINILLLGLDTLETRPGSPPLTDTLLLVSISPKDETIHMLSLPRDLWSKEYKTRINALYFYGIERYPDNPAQFPTEVLEELLEVKIQHTVVLSLDVVEAVIASLGGIPITVNEGFTDFQFPRTDVDVTQVTDPALLYETVVFEEGEQTFTAEQALQYMRSRHSGDTAGTDISRSKRQQDVLKSLGKKVTSKETLSDVTKLAQLFSIYEEHFSDAISLPEIIAALKYVVAFEPEGFEVVNNTLSIYPDDQDGVIVNPPLWQTNNEWIYEIKDRAAFQNEVHTKLGFDTP